MPTGNRRGAPGVADLQRRRDDEALLAAHSRRRRYRISSQERERRHRRHRFEQRARPRADMADAAPSSACARRAAARSRRPASRARGTGSTPVRPTRPAGCGRRSALMTPASRMTISSRTRPAVAVSTAEADRRPVGGAGGHDAARRQQGDSADGVPSALSVIGCSATVIALRPACRPRLRADPRPRRRSGSFHSS